MIPEVGLIQGQNYFNRDVYKLLKYKKDMWRYETLVYKSPLQ